MGTSFVFDREHALRINGARRALLQAWLPHALRALDATTALDVGCGVGHFTTYLAALGLDVTGVDARPENVREARARHPELRFEVGDIADPAILALGAHDLVLCLGLLYHLEDPFRAVRHLWSLTGSLIAIESMVVPDRAPVARIVDEGEGEDQSLRYVALVPSEAGLVKMLYEAGAPYVYRSARLPDHEDYRPTLRARRKRTVLVASAAPLALPELRPCAAPRGRDPWVRPGREGLDRLGDFARKPLPQKIVTVRRRLGL